MDLKDCYNELGGSYEDIFSRLPYENMVAKFAKKFLEDDCYGQLCQGLKDRNAKQAFMAAHTLKGVCQNLAFTRLFDACCAITEALRDGNLEQADTLFPDVEAAYEQTVGAIRKLPEDL